MKVNQIIGSIGVKGNRVIERDETSSSTSHRIVPLKRVGFTKAERKRILEIKREMRQYR